MLGFPAMILSIPPLMVLIPTVLAFGVQVAAAIIGIAAVLAFIVDGFVESGLSFFNRMLAL